MNCPQDIDLSAYADDMMAPAERARFHAHLAGCAVCQRRLEAIAALGRSLRALPSPPLGFDLAAQWDDRLRALPQGRQRTRPGWGWRGWLPAGLAGGLALASGIWLGSVLLGGGAVATPGAGLVRVFDPVPPGGLCAAAEICRVSRGMP
ncbi:putative transmembrane anti-sigma factor [Acidovorax delafieldii 2AN]|uniref:Putative transmembrane anti-sigma factor n=1 Tax=Acidovorax delafieldii 2AN TaxID=573060 RepID=C5TAA4_ACIDE|nr:zf-HC2 domain-containing protein [Acidovorax delafieldii]EER58590.1 putative transmembrane anti-sigma factor [Acidovorax delafieldii 2AN]